MKKIICFLLLAALGAAKAQPTYPQYEKEKFGVDLQPVNLVLQADKNLCELNEMVAVKIRIRMADINLVPYDIRYNFANPAEAPWKIDGFTVVSGGARINLVEGEVAQIQMPVKMPAEKAVLVQATLSPLKKGYAQVQLFTTIYLEDHENVFYFHCPHLGINHEKYVINQNGGALAGTNALTANQAAKKNSPQVNAAIQQYAMKAASAEVRTTQNGMDLAALTGNARAIYGADADVTAILLTGNMVEMEAGKKVNRQRMYTINLGFPGKTTGSFAIKTKNEIAAAITLPAMGTACACHDDPEEQKRREEAGEKGPTCQGGKIVITRYDIKEKKVEGYVFAQLESNDAQTGEVYYSWLQGKFKLPLLMPVK